MSLLYGIWLLIHTKLSSWWQTPWGDKEAIPGYDLLEISAKGSSTLNFPPEQKSGAWSVGRQLLMSECKDLLIDTVRADKDNGTLGDQRISVTSESDLPYPQVNQQRTCNLIKEAGTSGLHLIKKDDRIKLLLDL